jgi:AcrR family transcriptional regulator
MQPRIVDDDAARAHGSPPRRKRYAPRLSRDARRAQLLELAQGILRTGGLEALTMERLASEAGIAKPVVYRHFAHRDAVVLSLLRSEWQRIDDAIARLDPGLPWDESLRRIVAAFLDALARRSPWLRSLWGTPAVENARARRRTELAGVLAATFVARFDVDTREATAVAVMLLAAFDAAGRWWIDHRLPRPLVEKLCDDLARGTVAARGWRARRGRQKPMRNSSPQAVTTMLRGSQAGATRAAFQASKRSRKRRTRSG